AGGGPGTGGPGPDGRRHAHRADHVEVLRPIAERERLAANVAVGVHDRLAAEGLEGGAERGQPRDARLEGGRDLRGLAAVTLLRRLVLLRRLPRRARRGPAPLRDPPPPPGPAGGR